MSRFMKPATVVLRISENETLVVKKRLSRGEQAEMFALMRAPGHLGLQADAMRVSLERVLAYLVDWSITDNGKPVPYRDIDRQGRIDTLNSMTPEGFIEIRDAIDHHIATEDEAIEAEKKIPNGGTESLAKSGSADGSASPSASTTTSSPTSSTSA